MERSEAPEEAAAAAAAFASIAFSLMIEVGENARFRNMAIVAFNQPNSKVNKEIKHKRSLAEVERK